MGASIVGPQGETGPTGPTGPAGKGAIVKTTDGWHALWCLESPDVWFFDVVEMPDGVFSQSLDPLFVESCEEGTLKILCVYSPCGAVVLLKGRVLHNESGKTSTVTVAGIRKGMLGLRFKKYPERVALRNNAKWGSFLE